jgi:hypothetical protein
VHPLTAYLLNYIKRLRRYGRSLRRLFGDPAAAPDWQTAASTPRGAGGARGGALSSASNSRRGAASMGGGGSGGASEDEGMEGAEMEVIKGAIRRLLRTLRDHLDSRAKLYKSEGQMHFFLMNNYGYMVKAGQSSRAVLSLIGEDW